MLGLGLLPNGLALNEWLKKLPKSLPIGSTPAVEVGRLGSMRLLKYQVRAPRTLKEPLFLIPSLINRHYVLDLLPGKSLIEHFSNQGFQVYLIDWGIPSDEDRFLDFQALIQNRILAFIEMALEMEKSQKLHLIGHCLGGTLGSVVASLSSHWIRSFTLLTAPVHFPATGKLSKWAQHPTFDIDAFIEAYGHAPWALLQTAFLSLKPTLWLNKSRKVFAKRKDPEFQKNFWALEIWTADNISLIGPFYRMLLKDLYRRDALALGQLTLGHEKISLKKINCPVLNIFASDDHIVVPNSVMNSSDLSAGNFYEEIQMSGGHLGSLIGGRAQNTLWPQLSHWLPLQEIQEN